MNRTPYEQGRRAFANGCHIEENPFPICAPACFEWEEGWEHEQRQAGAVTWYDPDVNAFGESPGALGPH